jgi:hypothetical protein
MKAGRGFAWACGIVLLAGAALDRPNPKDRQADWLNATGTDWMGFSPEAKRAFLSGFLTGAALQQASAAGASDSQGLAKTIDSLRHAGLRFPYAPHVYQVRLDDYFWWENHRGFPIWYALREVNEDLTRAGQDGR